MILPAYLSVHNGIRVDIPLVFNSTIIIFFLLSISTGVDDESIIKTSASRDGSLIFSRYHPGWEITPLLLYKIAGFFQPGYNFVHYPLVRCLQGMQVYAVR